MLSEGASVTHQRARREHRAERGRASAVGLAEDDHVDVRAADVSMQFVRFGDPGYFYRNLTAHMNENSLGIPR